MIGSASSKASGLALQAIAMPMIYHSLGEHRFALYLLLTAALATIGLAQMGAGPGLTQGIAHANAAKRREREASLLNAAFRLTGLGAVFGGAVILSVIHLVPPDRLFGAAFAGDRVDILNAANVCVFFLMAQMVTGVVDSALAGYQEQFFSSLGSMAANVLSLVLLIIVSRHAPSLVGVIFVLYGVPTLARIANLLGLFVRRAYLLHGMLQSCRGFYSTLLTVGLAFWTIQFGGIIEQNGGTFILARLSSTHDTDLFAIVYKYLALASTAVGIVTQPLWPAITDAIAHRDVDWIRRSYARIRNALSIYSGLLAVITMCAGQWLFQLVLHVDTSGQYWILFFLSLYFVANIWTHLLYVTLMGMPGIWKVAAVLLTENLLMLLFGVLLVPHLGATGMAIAYLAASVVLPAWLLPRLMRRGLARISQEAAGVAGT